MRILNRLRRRIDYYIIESSGAGELTFGDFTYTVLDNGTVEIAKYNGKDTVVYVL